MSVVDIRQNTLHMFPYKLQVEHNSEDRDYTACIEFAKWCLENIQEDASFQFQVIYYDGSVFKVNGKVNKRNIRVQARKNRHETREVARDSEIVTVWCAMFVNQVISAYYFNSSVLTGETYKVLLTNYFLSVLPSLTSDEILKQEGTPYHYS